MRGRADALLDELAATFCVDEGRVYATGFSNGGMFVNRLGCDLAARFAAVAPVSGLLARGFNCAPAAAQPIMYLHGTQDNTVPLDGAASTDGYWYTSMTDLIDGYASAASQDCDASDTAYPTSGDGIQSFVCNERANCASGALVVGCTWRGNHAWPVKNPGNFYVNDVIWEFFSLFGGGGGGGDCGNGVCDPGEDCNTCSDCAGVTNGKPASRFCCGNGVQEGPEGDGSICDGNF